MDSPTTNRMTLEQIFRRYSEELGLYRSLLSMAIKQNRYLATGRLDEFTKLVEQNSRVLARIEEIESEPVPRGWFSGEHGRLPFRLTFTLDTITSLIRRTVAIEHQNERLLESCLRNPIDGLVRAAN